MLSKRKPFQGIQYQAVTSILNQKNTKSTEKILTTISAADIIMSTISGADITGPDRARKVGKGGDRHVTTGIDRSGLLHLVVA